MFGVDASRVALRTARQAALRFLGSMSQIEAARVLAISKRQAGYDAARLDEVLRDGTVRKLAESRRLPPIPIPDDQRLAIDDARMRAKF
jgi:hypothetical protein